MSEYIEEEFPEDLDINDANLLAIQQEYHNRRLIEVLIGPVVSTVSHIVLIIILAFMIKDKYQQTAPDIEVHVVEVEEIIIEEPPPIEEPEPIEEPMDSPEPALTTLAIENIETNDTALEDVSDEVPSTEDDSSIEAVSDITVSPSAFSSPSVFGGRSAAGRAASVSTFGGSAAGQAALLKALSWLKSVQNPNGSWGAKNPQAYTGLALLTFLAYGETHLSKAFGPTVMKAMKWLAQDKINKGHGNGYGHAIKTYAISEAFAMTGLTLLEEVMNKCIRIVITGQQDCGSYSYGYNRNQNKKQDLSIAGWNYQALKAASAAGCSEEGLQSAIQKAIQWLQKHGDSQNAGDDFPYDGVTGKGKGAHTIRAIGVLCLQLYGKGNSPGIKDEIKKIASHDLEKLSYEKPPYESLYGWYYATQTMFQSGGTNWKKWNRKFQQTLGKHQHQEGYWEYPGDYHGHAGDKTTERVYATTLCALMLTVYYRYLPSTKGNSINKAAKKELIEEIGIDLID